MWRHEDQFRDTRREMRPFDRGVLGMSGGWLGPRGERQLDVPVPPTRPEGDGFGGGGLYGMDDSIIFAERMARRRAAEAAGTQGGALPPDVVSAAVPQVAFAAGGPGITDIPEERKGPVYTKPPAPAPEGEVAGPVYEEGRSAVTSEPQDLDGNGTIEPWEILRAQGVDAQPGPTGQAETPEDPEASRRASIEQSAEEYAAVFGYPKETFLDLQAKGYRIDDNGDVYQGPGTEPVGNLNLPESLPVGVRAILGQGEKEGFDIEDLRGMLGDLQAPEVDQATLRRRQLDLRRQQAFQQARAIRASLEMGAHAGASPEYQSGMTAEVGHRMGVETASEESRMAMQAEMANLSSRSQWYQNQANAMLQMMRFAQDDNTRRAMFAQAQEMLRQQEASQKRLLEHQDELASPTVGEAVLGFFGNLGSKALVSYLGGLG